MSVLPIAYACIFKKNIFFLDYKSEMIVFFFFFR